MISLDNKKIEVEYPLIWKYKVIVEKEKNIKNIISLYINKDYKLKKSKQSKNGKYNSYSLELLVQNEEERTYIYEELKRDKNIKMVL